MKRLLITMIVMLLLLQGLCVRVFADKVYEYDLEEVTDGKDGGVLSELMDALPKEIKDELPRGEDSPSFEDFDFEFFFEKILTALKEALSPALKTFSGLLGIVMIGAVYELFSKNVSGEGVGQVFSLCASLCTSLCVFSSMEALFDVVKALLKTLSDTMLVMIPTMEAVYISSGNLTAAAVSATGTDLMIGLTEVLFSKVGEPLVYVSFILGVVSAVTKNRGIAFMTKTLRGMLSGGVMIIMTVMSFVLALQTAGASAADNLAQRTIKFAIGTYLPIVGGTVAESFSMLSGSIGVIKQACGITGIAVMIVAFLPPFAVILVNRLAVGLSGAVAGVLGCERESALLEECKSICTLLLALSAGACMMYLIAIGIFLRTPVAMG